MQSQACSTMLFGVGSWVMELCHPAHVTSWNAAKASLNPPKDSSSAECLACVRSLKHATSAQAPSLTWQPCTHTLPAALFTHKPGNPGQALGSPSCLESPGPSLPAADKVETSAKVRPYAWTRTAADTEAQARQIAFLKDLFDKFYLAQYT